MIQNTLNTVHFSPGNLLTIQEAATFLDVSESYLIRILYAGKIPHHKVGAYRRIRFEDVVKYKEARHAISQAALRELPDQAQKLGMGY